MSHFLLFRMLSFGGAWNPLFLTSIPQEQEMKDSAPTSTDRHLGHWQAIDSSLMGYDSFGFDVQPPIGMTPQMTPYIKRHEGVFALEPELDCFAGKTARPAVPHIPSYMFWVAPELEFLVEIMAVVIGTVATSSATVALARRSFLARAGILHEKIVGVRVEIPDGRAVIDLFDVFEVHFGWRQNSVKQLSQDFHLILLDHLAFKRFLRCLMPPFGSSFRFAP
jgi:hypothetical protein